VHSDLIPPDSHHLRAAEGWLELGNHFEANEELEKISPELRIHPDVLQIRWHIFENAKKWDACVDIAATLIKLAAERSAAWVQRSYALHALKRTQEALDGLLPAAEKFPDVWRIPYNLACYCSQLGRFEEAQHWFKKAILIDDKTVQRIGIDDPDLKPLWDSMSTTIWKR
jgi:tetratricopeptide (TPR) repeat protein